MWGPFLEINVGPTFRNYNMEPTFFEIVLLGAHLLETQHGTFFLGIMMWGSPIEIMVCGPIIV